MVDLGLLVGTWCRGPFHTRYMRLGYLYKVGIMLSVCYRLDSPSQAVGQQQPRSASIVTLCDSEIYILNHLKCANACM